MHRIKGDWRVTREVLLAVKPAWKPGGEGDNHADWDFAEAVIENFCSTLLVKCAHCKVEHPPHEFYRCWDCKAHLCEDCIRHHMGPRHVPHPKLKEQYEAELARMQRLVTGYQNECDEVEQIAGKALGYPWYKDDQVNFPGADDASGVCIGEHVAVTIVSELANRYKSLRVDDNEVLLDISDDPHKPEKEYIAQITGNVSNELNQLVGWLNRKYCGPHSALTHNAIDQDIASIRDLCAAFLKLTD